MSLVMETCEVSKNIVSFGSRAHAFHEYLQADLKNEKGFHIDVVIPFGIKVSNMKRQRGEKKIFLRPLKLNS
jgi:hypothetical protein